MARTFASASTQWLLKSSAVTNAYPATFSAWVNVTNFTASRGIIGINVTSGAGGPSLYTDTSGHLILDMNGSGAATTTVTISASTWTHAAAVALNATSRSVYINGGSKITNATSVAWTGASQTLIGNIWEGGNFPMNGAIAFAGIWNAALADADILSLANGAHPTLVRPASLVACVNMSGGNSPEPDVVSATGWTLNGAPTVVANPRIYMP